MFFYVLKGEESDIMMVRKGDIMNIISVITESIKKISGIQNEYVVLTLLSLILVLGFRLMCNIIIHFYKKKHYHQAKELFRFHQRTNVIFTIITVFALYITWEKHLANIITLISFISAGATIALREVILNLFAGFYIKVSRPFVVEDRIELGDIKGDVVLINALSFKLLAIGERVADNQSNGIIVTVPNSFVFSHNLKNYTTAFKYIWSELVVPIPVTSDVKKSKKILYKIINNNEVVKEIPNKMMKAIEEASSNYRIYYNNLKPFIYTTYKDNHIELCIRFLVHPKKERNVIDDVWQNIIKEHQLKHLELYLKS